MTHASDFATTHWSMVVAAGRRSSPGAQQALETLCDAYWYPLYAYARRRARDIHEARDWTQAFFVELLNKNSIVAATPDRGRFRSFLLTAFKHFLSKEWDKAQSQKRGGGRAPISLDFQSADSKFSIDPADQLTPECYYDQQWAIALLERIMERLQGEFKQRGKEVQFNALKGFLIGDEIGETYAQVAHSLEMTEVAARKAVSRMRQRYRELLRSEIAQTVTGPDEVEDEIRDLFGILQQ